MFTNYNFKKPLIFNNSLNFTPLAYIYIYIYICMYIYIYIYIFTYIKQSMDFFEIIFG